MKNKFSIEGEIFFEIEELGNKKYEHIGFRDSKNEFPKLLLDILKKPGTRKRAKVTIEIEEQA